MKAINPQPQLVYTNAIRGISFVITSNEWRACRVELSFPFTPYTHLLHRCYTWKKNEENFLFLLLQDIILSIYWKIEGLAVNFAAARRSSSQRLVSHRNVEWLLLQLFLSFTSLPTGPWSRWKQKCGYLSSCSFLCTAQTTRCGSIETSLRYQFIRSLLKTKTVAMTIDCVVVCALAGLYNVRIGAGTCKCTRVSWQM